MRLPPKDANQTFAEVYRRPNEAGRQANQEVFRDEDVSVEEEKGEDEYEYDYAMSLSELLYSTSSFYAIVVPGEYYYLLSLELFSITWITWNPNILTSTRSFSHHHNGSRCPCSRLHQ